MKKQAIKYILLSALLGLFACSSGGFNKLTIEIPGEPGVDLTPFDAIALTNFLVEDDKAPFDLNQDLLDYFSFELKQNLGKNIEIKDWTPPGIDRLEDAAFWASQFPDLKKTLLFTGSLGFREESRKALIQKKEDKFETPFDPLPKLAQQRFYAIDLDVFLIDSETGKPIFSRNFKERRTYSNPNQTTRFAFYDLLGIIKDKLIQGLAGKRQSQDRFLITK